MSDLRQLISTIGVVALVGWRWWLAVAKWRWLGAEIQGIYPLDDRVSFLEVGDYPYIGRGLEGLWARI